MPQVPPSFDKQPLMVALLAWPCFGSAFYPSWVVVQMSSEELTSLFARTAHALAKSINDNLWISLHIIRFAGFNPARKDDVRLFAAVLLGDYLLQGFRNRDIRVLLWGEVQDTDQQHRQANRVTRLVKRLHVRGLVAKIPRTRRGRVTDEGHKILGTIIQLHYHGLSTVA